MSDRETLEHLLEVDATFDDESTAKPLNPNEAAAIRAVLADNERLRGALKGQPVIKSEWEEKCAEVERLRAEAARLEEKRIELLEAIRVARDRLEGAGGVLSALDVDP